MRTQLYTNLLGPESQQCRIMQCEDVHTLCNSVHILCNVVHRLRDVDVLGQERRTQLFSATMTSKVAKLQRACLRDPVKVEVSQKYQAVKTLRENYLFIPAKYKVRIFR